MWLTRCVRAHSIVTIKYSPTKKPAPAHSSNHDPLNLLQYSSRSYATLPSYTLLKLHRNIDTLNVTLTLSPKAQQYLLNTITRGFMKDYAIPQSDGQAHALITTCVQIFLTPNKTGLKEHEKAQEFVVKYVLERSEHGEVTSERVCERANTCVNERTRV